MTLWALMSRCRDRLNGRLTRPGKVRSNLDDLVRVKTAALLQQLLERVATDELHPEPDPTSDLPRRRRSSQRSDAGHARADGLPR